MGKQQTNWWSVQRPQHRSRWYHQLLLYKNIYTTVMAFRELVSDQVCRSLVLIHNIQWFRQFYQDKQSQQVGFWVEKYKFQHEGLFLVCSCSDVSWFYACTSLTIVKSTVFGKVFRRDTALPWSIFTKLYPFAWEGKARFIVEQGGKKH